MNMSFTALFQISLYLLVALFFFSVSYSFPLFCIIKIASTSIQFSLDLLSVFFVVGLYSDGTESKRLKKLKCLSLDRRRLKVNMMEP